MNQYVPEQAETRTTFSEEADDHRPAENIQEVTEEPLQLDLVTNIVSVSSLESFSFLTVQIGFFG